MATAYGGATTVAWGNPQDSHWGIFAGLANAQPTTTVWVQFCTRPATVESDVANYAAALSILAEIERRIPGATVYVSGQNGYVAPHTCGATGPDGPARARTLAQQLAQEGRALLGPDVGDLLSVDSPASAGATPESTQTLDDGCHPNEAGKRLIGQRLRQFFG